MRVFSWHLTERHNFFTRLPSWEISSIPVVSVSFILHTRPSSAELSTNLPMHLQIHWLINTPACLTAPQIQASKSHFTTSFSRLPSKSLSPLVLPLYLVALHAPSLTSIPQSINPSTYHRSVKSPCSQHSFISGPRHFPLGFSFILPVSSCWRVLLPILFLHSVYLGLQSYACVTMWCLSLQRWAPREHGLDPFWFALSGYLADGISLVHIW